MFNFRIIIILNQTYYLCRKSVKRWKKRKTKEVEDVKAQAAPKELHQKKFCYTLRMICMKHSLKQSIEMSISGYALIGTGIVFFIVTQVLLNRWVKAYNAEQRGDGYDR